MIPQSLSLPLLLLSCLSAQRGDPRIRVDHFGYLPAGRKVAILREAVVGHDAPTRYTPPSRLEIRRVPSDTVAFAAAPTAWNRGAVHAQSGDRVWWFDFSQLSETGTFRVWDPTSRIGSEPFRIATDVYEKVLEQACRMYFYQRSGFAKRVPYAEAAWADAASHLGPEQDKDCRLVTNPVPATSKDLSGGWFDAGDYNKYTNFADDALHPLASAFLARPHAWPDDFGIPESGNGEPDLLDEIRWETDWLLKMQLADGSVLHKVSVTDFAAAHPPSKDRAKRRYAPATASATISFAGALAHVARAFRAFGSTTANAYAQRLQDAAVRAWTWLERNPSAIPSSYDNRGFQNVSAEDSSYWQDANRTRAAIHLAILTGAKKYRDYVESSYRRIHMFQWQTAIVWEQPLHAALLEYANDPHASLVVANAIRTTFAQSIAREYGNEVATQSDAYRSWLADRDYTWGSNRTKAMQGQHFVMMNRYGLEVARAGQWHVAGTDYLHWFFGVNPTGYCFLTNMKRFGSEQSVQETYHAWFADGSDWDNATTSKHGPAPGYLTGGVNPTYVPDKAWTGGDIVPPMKQPIQKSYLDWNTGWPQNSWAVTECHIPYQADFIALLSELAVGSPSRLGIETRDFAAGKTAAVRIGGIPQGSAYALFVSTRAGRLRVDTPAWCFDLGLDASRNPATFLLHLGVPDGNGSAELRLPLQRSWLGLRVIFQASASGACPDTVQSSVRVATIR